MLAAGTAAAVGLWATGAYLPDGLLRAEFARQRWAAGAAVNQRQVGDHRWTYLQAGPAEAPLIVLVHGFTGSKENWLPLMAALGERYRVIAPDLPGWGESTRLAGADYGPLAQARRLAEFIATLPRTPALLVGHSMGGQIAGLVASRHPQALSRLMLISAAGVQFRANPFATAVLAGDNPFAVYDRASLDRYLDIVFTDPPWLPWPADRAYIARRQRDAAFEQTVLDRIGRGPEALLLQDELRAIRVPTRLLWCNDDAVIDVSAMDVFRAGIAGSEAEALPGCSHMPMMEQPAAVAARVVTLLEATPLR